MLSLPLRFAKTKRRSALNAVLLSALAVPVCVASDPAVAKGHRKRSEKPAMLQTRIEGPYALSVRDGLNEMLIDTQLISHGMRSTAETSASLPDVMNSLPSILPAQGYISSGYGYRRSPFTGREVHHNGIDFAVPYGSPVRATADGVIVTAGWHHYLGKMVAIDHGYGIVTRYGHNSTLLVKVGQHVHRGELIAKAGSTGRSTGSHVHYEVWLNHQLTDPGHFMFEVPSERILTAPNTAVAMDEPYGAKNQPRLGLAMGGDEDDAMAFFSARMAMPTPAERLPINLAITGAFFLVALLLVGSMLPAMRHEEDDGLGFSPVN